MNEKISKVQAKDALRRSGYLLESRIEDILLKSGYLVYPSPTYLDHFTGKPREIDLIAIKGEDVEAPKVIIDITFTLIIECINNSQPLCFIENTSRKNIGYFNDINYMSDALKVSSNPITVELPYEDNDKSGILKTDIATIVACLPSHHYFRENGSTQYCTFTPKKEKGKDQSTSWMAWHDNEHHDLFCKFQIAIDEEIQKHQFWIKQRPKDIKINVLYPILIIQGELWNVCHTKKSLSINNKKHVHYLRCSQSKANKNLPELLDQYQHIDVITESYFEKFLHILDNQILELKQELFKNKKYYIEAVEKAYADTLKGYIDVM